MENLNKGIIKRSMEALNRKSVDEFREADKLPIVVILENIRSAYNVGSVFRTADAFLLESIYLGESAFFVGHRRRAVAVLVPLAVALPVLSEIARGHDAERSARVAAHTLPVAAGGFTHVFDGLYLHGAGPPSKDQ